MPINISKNSMEKIPHSCFVKLQAVYDSLKSAEKKAADLLLERPEFFSCATIIEAAEAASCSESTLVRLAKRLGFSGYPELKSQLANEKDASRLYAGITENDSYEDILNKVFKASIQALYDTLEILNKDDFSRAADAICSAKKLVLCGVGDAAAVARSGYQKFIRIGLDVHASADPDVQLITASHLSQGDVLVAISHSGRTRSLLDVVKYAHSTGAVVIAITNYPVSPLTKNSDIVLLTAAFAEHAKGEVMSKRLPELCLLESLFISVLHKQHELYSENLNRSNNALEINKI